MHDELAARQRAIALRLSGRPVQSICQALGRSTFWFHKWWRRYLEAGPEGLYDLTHATHHVAQRIAPELERVSFPKVCGHEVKGVDSQREENTDVASDLHPRVQAPGRPPVDRRGARGGRGGPPP